PRKNWNFPKVHLHQHAFDDIRAKGVTKNYNTKPNKKMHGPLKKAYLRRTNFKDVAPQILKIDHRSYVTGLIHEQIDDYEDYITQLADSEEPEDDLDPLEASSLHQKVFDADHISLGSQQKAIALGQFETSHSHLLQFKDF
ncbi:hypothetical protein OF83DRAFT_1070829, partial [Amylostereum chailletii]